MCTWTILFVSLPFIMDLAEAKYCAYELGGETRFYVCPRTEYCCNFGCCVSPAFQFYQLWYYWLLVIFMFLLCSGGGWWYRCWLRGRYPDTPVPRSALPRSASQQQQQRRSALLRTTRSAPPDAAPGPQPQPEAAAAAGQFQVARLSYSTSGERLILHRLWKDAHGGLHPLDSPPSYSTARAEPPGAPAVLMNPYVLYGPPPSYDSVVLQDQAGPSGTQSEGPPLELSPSSEGSSAQPSPDTPPSLSPQQSPTADGTSDEEHPPQTSHQASQTASSPVVSPTSP